MSAAAVDLLSLHAIEREKLPPTWRWKRLAMADQNGDAFSIEGAETQAGPTGELAWVGVPRVVKFQHEEHRAWCEAWKKRTGGCIACAGSGGVEVRAENWKSRTIACGRCGGSGRAS